MFAYGLFVEQRWLLVAALVQDLESKLSKSIGTTRLLNEGMLQHFVGSASLAGIEFQTVLQEVNELWRPPVRVMYGGGWGSVDHQQCLHLIVARGTHAERRLPVVRWLAVSHLQRGDAQRPNVHTAIVRRAADQLGSHPEGCAHDGLAAVLLLRKPYSEAKVGKFNLALCVHKHIVRFNVAVQFVVAVQVRQRRQHILAHVRDVRLGEVNVRSQDLRQASRIHKLHRNLYLTLTHISYPEFVIPKVTIADRYNVLLIAHALQCQLILQVFQI